MKKLGAILIIGTLFLTGCGSKVVCSSTIKDEDSTTKMKVTANMKSGKVSSVDAEMTFNSEDEANKTCSTLALISSFSSSEDGKKLEYKCKGKKITIKNYDSLSSSEDGKLVGLTKEEFINKMTDSSTEEEKVTCK